MTDRERYFWDLSGYLILRGVLDPAEIAAANAAIDHYAGSIERGADNTLARIRAACAAAAGRPCTGCCGWSPRTASRSAACWPTPRW